ncbi:MAG: hypothetical protein QOI48_3641 [Solirubrobacteraceae bacterium]|jgi:hypothetical protein|nr:hypothetical protein [Solirubrobacteraceae bacterium]
MHERSFRKADEPRRRFLEPAAAAAPATVESLLYLQSSAGNQAVGRFLRGAIAVHREPTPTVEPPASGPAPEAPEAPDSLGAPPPPPTVTRRRVTRMFAGCSEAQAWAKDNLGQNNSDANVAPQSGLTVTIGERHDQVTASAMLTFALDPETSLTLVTEPTWPNMTEAEKTEVQAYIDAMQAHEDGHIAAADKVYHEQSKVIEGLGDSEQAAREARREAATQHLEQTEARAVNAHNDYDKTTDHGRNQAAIGGKNTVLNCPPSP